MKIDDLRRATWARLSRLRLEKRSEMPRRQARRREARGLRSIVSRNGLDMARSFCHDPPSFAKKTDLSASSQGRSFTTYSPRLRLMARDTDHHRRLSLRRVSPGIGWNWCTPAWPLGSPRCSLCGDEAGNTAWLGQDGEACAPCRAYGSQSIAGPIPAATSSVMSPVAIGRRESRWNQPAGYRQPAGRGLGGLTSHHSPRSIHGLSDLEPWSVIRLVSEFKADSMITGSAQHSPGSARIPAKQPGRSQVLIGDAVADGFTFPDTVYRRFVVDSVQDALMGKLNETAADFKRQSAAGGIGWTLRFGLRQRQLQPVVGRGSTSDEGASAIARAPGFTWRQRNRLGDGE